MDNCRGLSFLDESGEFHGCRTCPNCKKSLQKIFDQFTDLKKNVEKIRYELSEAHKNYFKSIDEFAYEDIVNKVDDAVYSLGKMVEKFS